MTTTRTGHLTQQRWSGAALLRAGRWALDVTRDDGSTYRHATYRTRDGARRGAARYGITLDGDDHHTERS